MGRLTGYRLKFDPAEPAQGIFFVAASGKVTQTGVVGKDDPSKLMLFLVPASLKPGDSLEIRSVMGNDTVFFHLRI